jgi:hypothetical protein
MVAAGGLSTALAVKHGGGRSRSRSAIADFA